MSMTIKSSIPSPTRRDAESVPVEGPVAVVAVAGPIKKAELSVPSEVSSELVSELGAQFPEPSVNVQCTQYTL